MRSGPSDAASTTIVPGVTAHTSLIAIVRCFNGVTDSDVAGFCVTDNSGRSIGDACTFGCGVGVTDTFVLITLCTVSDAGCTGVSVMDKHPIVLRLF